MSPASPWRILVNGIFFNPTIRYALLRVVCASTLLLLLSFPSRKITNPFKYVVVSLTFVHHFASAFGPRLSLPGAIDLALVVAAAVSYTYPLNTFSRWSPQEEVVAVTLYWIIAISLMLLAVLRLAKSFTTGWRYLWTRYDVRETYGPIPHGVNRGGRPAADSPMYVLFGRKIWEAQLIGENLGISIFRGLFAILLVAAIAVFALFNIVVEPVRESGLVPAKEVRSIRPPDDFVVTTPVVWNVVVTKMTHPINPRYPTNVASFASAVSVVPLWDSVSDESGPSCFFAQDKSDWHSLLYHRANATFQYATFHCPPRIEIPKENLQYLTPVSYNAIRPDLIVTVNFTKLNITFNNSTRNVPSHSVQVMLGLTNDTESVILRTLPTTLVPGMNVVGMANLLIRQQYDAKGVFATFGLFDSYETILISEMAHVSTDPIASNFSLIARAPDIATIRIISQADTSEWRIVQDYRDKSALNGFASVGGLWSFLGGIFAVLFGLPILQIVFGVKSISVFGLVHSFQEDRIRNVCHDKYPQMSRDLDIPPSQWGLMSFLVHYLIDVDVLHDPDTNSSRQSTSISETIPLDNLDGHANEAQDINDVEDLPTSSDPVRQNTLQ